MYQQDFDTKIMPSSSKIYRETQFGPWKSETAPLTFKHHTQNQILNPPQPPNENKRQNDKSTVTKNKIKKSSKYTDYIKKIESEQKNYKLQIVRSDEKILLPPQNTFLKQRSQKYLGGSQIRTSKSKILNKLKSKLNAIDNLQNSPASASLTRSRQILVHKAELKEIKANFHRYNEQIMSNRPTKKSKGFEKYLQASLLRTLKTNTDKLLSIDRERSLNQIYKTKSNKTIMYRQFNIIKARNSVTKGKQKFDLQLKKEKVRLTPIQVSFF